MTNLLRSSHRVVGRAAVAQLATAAAVAALAFPPTSTHAASVSDPPPLPAQPGIASGSCTPAAPGFFPWTTIISTTHDSSAEPNAAFDAFQVVVDPWMPCRMYRVRDAQTVERSTDSGATWQTIFIDKETSSSPTGTAFAGSQLSVPAPNTVVFAENGNGDAVVRSDDAGRTWHLANGGIAGLPIYAISSAAGNALVEYALVTNDQIVTGQASLVDPVGYHGFAPSGRATTPATVGLYVTDNGGATWTAANLPAVTTAARCDGWCSRDLLLRVDPLDPHHIFLAWNSMYTPVVAASTILESRDAGQTWSVFNTFQLPVHQLIVERSEREPLRVYALVNDYNGTTLEKYDGADGSWSTIDMHSLSTTWGASLAVDPSDPDTMFFVGFLKGGELTALSSSDGFKTADVVPFVPGSFEMVAVETPLEPSPRGDYGTLDPELQVQADHLGYFYVVTQQWCYTTECKTAPGQPGTTNVHRQTYWRYAVQPAHKAAVSAEARAATAAGRHLAPRLHPW